MGNAVNNAIDALVTLIAEASVDDATRDGWLERLWNASEEDGMGYLESILDRWGDLCGSEEIASRWAGSGHGHEIAWDPATYSWNIVFLVVPGVVVYLDLLLQRLAVHVSCQHHQVPADLVLREYRRFDDALVCHVGRGLGNFHAPVRTCEKARLADPGLVSLDKIDLAPGSASLGVVSLR